MSRAIDIANGTLTTDGTEQEFYENDWPGIFRLYIDLTAMILGDVVNVRVYKLTFDGATNGLVLAEDTQYNDVQDVPLKKTDIYEVSSDVLPGIMFKVEQSTGSPQNFDYDVVSY